MIQYDRSHCRCLSLRASILFVATGLLSLEAAEGASLVNGGWRELNVLLGGHPDHERRNVHELLSNRNVSLSDEDARVVKRLGVGPRSNLGLQSPLHELANRETEDVIGLALVLLQQAELDDSADERIALEGSSWIILLEGEEFSGSLSQFSERQLNS